MTTAAIQTIWAELLASTLADAGITTCVISPGSRSTPLVAALAGESRLELVTIIDERAAAFFALGAARATGIPAAIVCTSGTAAAHYLPAVIEASLAGVPLVVITADRPPELQGCGASQTIDQVGLYGSFVREAFDLGAPVGQVTALRGLRRKLVQAITLARGPHAGPVHIEVPLRKPLEPAQPSTDEERAFARAAAELCGPVTIAPPRLAADPGVLDGLAAAIAAEPDGVIVVGAMPASFARDRDAVFALAARTGYPVIAEAGSQLRFGPRPARVVLVDHADLIPVAQRPMPRVVIQLGADPVAASWPAWLAALATVPRSAVRRWVLAGPTWSDPDSAAHQVILGDVGDALARVVRTLGDVPRTTRPPTFGDRENTIPGLGDPSTGAPLAVRDQPTDRQSSQRIRATAWLDTWRDLDTRARIALERALAQHPRNEASAIAAAIDAVPEGAAIQIGNSLPIRTIDHVCSAGVARTILTQRGAAGIDGLIASAAGATRAGQPVLLVLGDVSFAHDLGGLLAARCASAPLAILVVDNCGGQIFAGLPVARASLGAAFERHFVTAPEIDPSAVALALGANALTAASPAAVGSAVTRALATPGVTVIHAPVSVSGAHDVRRTALELYAAPRSTDVRSAGGTHE
ncbi:MAG: 2-succinyl-6-hydroxy-2,4-cyclohexadiene-carboxylic acid synthase/2-oxoglutarate decarboxylase [Myxococcales bacterium]|nr:2-succinyl-6-hydroxy-2,4-cyclohexadiene-carboxylic acid synthase/2-oxoglutarate decarboxylase [Myxococcales bacterium]